MIARGLRRIGLGLLVQLAELGNDLVREDVRSPGDHLAELDEGRPELLERFAKTGCVALRFAGFSGFGLRPETQPLGVTTPTLRRGHPGDLREPAESAIGSGLLLRSHLGRCVAHHPGTRYSNSATAVG